MRSPPAKVPASKPELGPGASKVKTTATSAGGVTRMLEGLAEIGVRKVGNSELATVCDLGARYGLERLSRSMLRTPSFGLTAKTKQSLRINLRRDLMRITRPCFDLERRSYQLARQALGPLTLARAETSGNADGVAPDQQLFRLLKRFPVLAELWSLLIEQWQRNIWEVCERAASDRALISRSFFDGTPVGSITDIRPGLSEPHAGGRSVVRLRFGNRSVIYKPRAGNGEWEWSSILEWMNTHSFSPKLRAAGVVRRKNYCWMQDIPPAPCENQAAVSRFFQRIGALAALACLLKAVDCHRENLIASGEFPVLVDTDALWHVSEITQTQSATDLLYRTGFFPSRNRQSLQSRSSILGRSTTGVHLPRIGKTCFQAAPFAEEIIGGFTAAWDCLLATADRRASFRKHVRRVRTSERRWIYRATATYANIRKASVQPTVLRSPEQRELLLRRLCAKPGISAAVRAAEAKSLRRLDIPYFTHRTKHSMPAPQPTLPATLLTAIREALSW